MQKSPQIFHEYGNLPLVIGGGLPIPGNFFAAGKGRHLSLQDGKHQFFVVAAISLDRLAPGEGFGFVLRIFFEEFFQIVLASLGLVVDEKAAGEIVCQNGIWLRRYGDGENGLRVSIFQRTLRILIKKAQTVHFVTEKFDAKRMSFIDRKYVHNVAAHRKVAAALDLRCSFVAGGNQFSQELIPLDFFSQTNRESAGFQTLRRGDSLRRFYGSRENHRRFPGKQGAQRFHALPQTLRTGEGHIIARIVQHREGIHLHIRHEKREIFFPLKNGLLIRHDDDGFLIGQKRCRCRQCLLRAGDAVEQVDFLRIRELSGKGRIFRDFLSERRSEAAIHLEFLFLLLLADIRSHGRAHVGDFSDDFCHVSPSSKCISSFSHHVRPKRKSDGQSVPLHRRNRSKFPPAATAQKPAPRRRDAVM